MPIIAGRASAAYGAGFGAVSAAPSVGPLSAYDALGSVIVGAGGVSTISFANIPSDYQHLQMRSFAPSGAYATIRFNGDTTTSNYRGHYLIGSGSGAISGGTNANNAYHPEAGGWSNTWSGILDILEYSNVNKYKVARDTEGFDANGSGETYAYSFLWMSNSAITSIEITTVGTFGQYSQFSIYGVK